jgi:hypothetical protein
VPRKVRKIPANVNRAGKVLGKVLEFSSYSDLDCEADLGWNALKRGVQSYVAEYASRVNGPFTQFYIGNASKCTCTSMASGTA